MTLFRYSIALLAFVCVAFITTGASAQEPDEDMESINQAYAAILNSMPREGDLLMPPFVSNIGVRGAKSVKTIDADVAGGKAKRIRVEKGENNWDTVVTAPIGPAVKAGDLLVIVYFARVEEGPGEMPYNVIQLNAAPYTAIIQGGDTLTDEWNAYVVQGKAPNDIEAGKLSMELHLASAQQVIDMGPAFVLNLGSGE